MPKPYDFGSVDLDVTLGNAPRSVRQPDDPFRILVLGDFGATGEGRAKPVRVDRDNFDDVMERMAVEVAGSLRFDELDDFHPDRLYATPLFAKLREQRDNPDLPPMKAQAAAAPPVRSAPVPAGGSLLDALLEETEERAPQETDDLRAFIDRALAPHLEQRQDPRAAVALADAEQTIAARLRDLLRAPAFQSLEAAWRAVYFLVRRVPDDDVHVYLLHAPKRALTPELLHDALGTEAWAAILGNYRFEKSEDDLALLRGLGKFAQTARAPFLAEGFVPDDEAGPAQDRWNALRHSKEGEWIGLALPRFLLRLPYGAATDAIESFPFEEMPAAPQHEAYLWGNPAFACAYLMADPDAQLQIDGVPLHVYREGSEHVSKPCAEVLLKERDIDFLLDHGIMPLASVKNADSVRLVRLQSIAGTRLGS